MRKQSLGNALIKVMKDQYAYLLGTTEREYHDFYRKTVKHAQVFQCSYAKIPGTG